jgi:hypothetical protein
MLAWHGTLLADFLASCTILEAEKFVPLSWLVIPQNRALVHLEPLDATLVAGALQA